MLGLVAKRDLSVNDPIKIKEMNWDSNIYIEKFRLLENPVALDKICLTMAEKYKDQNIDLVVSAAIGGILLSGGVGKHLNCKHFFSERVDGKMKFKIPFTKGIHKNIYIVFKLYQSVSIIITRH